LRKLIRGFASGYPIFQLQEGAFGYFNGDTVTQATDKQTAFTLNEITGRIIFAGGALAAFTASSSTWTNSWIGSYDVVAFNQNSGTIGKYAINAICSAGQAQLIIYNASNGSLTEAVAVSFVVIKGSHS
jgi:hypothetical protein